MTTTAALEARQLTCVRSGRLLFRELDLAVARGEIWQVEGENGAGKTSLLRILCGLTLPREGGVYWAGTEIRACRAEYHRNLLYSGHYPGIKEELTPLENLRFFYALGGHRGGDALLEEVLDTVGLFGFEDVPVRTLSAGQRRRVGLARLWLADAPLWILDEPFTAIDRQGVARLESRLAEHAAGGGMVILTSHQPLHLPAASVRSLNLK